MNNGLEILILNAGSKSANFVGIVQWAKKWDWGVGEVIAQRLCNDEFEGSDTIIVLTMNGVYAGFCVLEKRDAWGTDIDELLTPFITALYVDPMFRGNRLSEKLIETACNLVHSSGLGAVYLISNHEGFYEKLGFEIVAQTVTLSGKTEPIFRKYLC